ARPSSRSAVASQPASAWRSRRAARAMGGSAESGPGTPPAAPQRSPEDGATDRPGAVREGRSDQRSGAEAGR
ncbi:MAG: hypothetical protein ABJF67_18015, partial [Aurantimonas coralicida]